MRQALSGESKEIWLDQLADRQAKYVAEQVTHRGGSAQDAVTVLLRAASTALAVYEGAHKIAIDRLPAESMKVFARENLDSEIEEALRVLLFNAEEDANKLRRAGVRFSAEHDIQYQATEETEVLLWQCANCGYLLAEANSEAAQQLLREHCALHPDCRGHGVEELRLAPGVVVEMYNGDVYTVQQVSLFLGKHLMFLLKAEQERWLTLAELRSAF